MSAADTISSDLPCHTCGYNLRGLPHTGQCPECASSIAKSLPRGEPLTSRQAGKCAWAFLIMLVSTVLEIVGVSAALYYYDRGWNSLWPFPSSFLSSLTATPFQTNLFAALAATCIGTLGYAVGVALLVRPSVLPRVYPHLPDVRKPLFTFAWLTVLLTAVASAGTLAPFGSRLASVAVPACLLAALSALITCAVTLTLAEGVADRLKEPALVGRIELSSRIATFAAMLGGCFIPPFQLIVLGAFVRVLWLVFRACRKRVLRD